jgi:hypothetical protein
MFTALLQQSSRLRVRFGRLAMLSLGTVSLVGGLTALAGVTPAGALPSNVYVTATGSNAGNCSSASAPCATVQYAYTHVATGGTINVGAGTFLGGIVTDKSVNILGTNSGGSLDGTTTTFSRGGGNFGYVLEIDNGTVNVSNVVINGAFDDLGGGVDINSGAIVNLTNVNVVDNVSNQFSGAGVENAEGTLTMTGGSISGNTDAGTYAIGGGLANFDGTSTIKNVAFNHDVANNEGGAIFIDAGTVKLEGTTSLHNNSAGVTGGGIEKCSSSTLVLGASVVNTGNTPNDFNATDPTGDCT